MTETKIQNQAIKTYTQYASFSGVTTTSATVDVVEASELSVTVDGNTRVIVTISGTAQNNTDTDYFTVYITKAGASVKSSSFRPAASGIGHLFSNTYSEVPAAGTHTFAAAMSTQGGDSCGFYNSSILVQLVPA